MLTSCSLGQPIFSENLRSRSGSSAGRSTKSIVTTPPARPSAVSTDSVIRCLAFGRTTARSTTTSTSCLRFLSIVGSSVSGCVSPSMRTRLYPSPISCLNSSACSPFRPRTSGARIWKRVPSSSDINLSTIC